MKNHPKNIKIENMNVILLNSIERGTALVSTFQGGYTKEWFFKLPVAFRSALDIKLTTRQLNNQKHQVWTQGTMFSFKQGDTFYDSFLAYSLPWGDALKVFSFCIQVDEAMPDRYEAVEANPIVRNGMRLNLILNQFHDGFVRFKILRSNRNELEEIAVHKSTQKEFLRLLQIGVFVSQNFDQIDLVNDIFDLGSNIVHLKKLNQF